MNRSVLLVDDHKILREGLRALLDEAGDFSVVGEAGSGREAIQLAKTLAPDVVVMDVAMAEMNGIEACRQLQALRPGIQVLALSMHSDSRYVKQMLEAGARGYLLKENAFDELVQALRTIASGKTYVSPQATSGDLLADLGRGQLPPDGAGQLTPRERETLQLIAEGRSTSEIAGQLFVSVKTIETHRKNIMDKLGLHSIAELTKYAVREGLTSLE